MNDGWSSATVHFGGAGLYVATSPSGHAVVLETDGQRNSAPTPVELLLMALGACTGSDVVSIMQKKRERITSFRVDVRGHRREQEPRSYDRIEIKYKVRGHDISEPALKHAIELSETKYCSVAATLRPAASLNFAYEIVAEEESATAGVK